MHRFPTRLFLCSILFLCTSISTAQTPTLTVEKIMQDPGTWIGAWPRFAYWGEDGETLYFSWNPKGAFPSDSLFKVTLADRDPVQVSTEERLNLPHRFSGWHDEPLSYTPGFSKKVFEHSGDLYLYDLESQKSTRLTQTRDREANPRFTPDASGIVFERDQNLYRLELDGGAIRQLTDVRSGQEPGDAKPSNQKEFLEEQQLALFDFIREENEEDELQEAARERDRKREGPPAFYTGKMRVQRLAIDPSERFVTAILGEAPSNNNGTLVQDYVTESGYAEDLRARPKVGSPLSSRELHLQDTKRDTVVKIDLHQLPGSYDVPSYQAEMGVEVDSAKTKRQLFPVNFSWSGDGAYAVVEVRAGDNKDRWIARLNPEDGSLTTLDRQHDDAWVAGPGIGWSRGGGTSGWMPDNRHFYFQSERTGYSHLYIVDVKSGEVIALTEGEFEVFNPSLSRDGKTWHFTSSERSPHERHFYSMPAMGGKRTRLTDMPGNNQVSLSPDEKTMAIVHSESNRPPEVFLQKLGEQAARVTHSTTEGWEAYPWRVPEIIRFEASDGVEVPARIYEPETKNGAAVLFVHGAGYLQNVHRWWSNYFREYMFHNLLADLGYTVVDVDYRASAGYGRDWRTAIYRHMGGRDLQDYVDASRYLNEEHGIDPERVFIYGGSYGGFITLMALFTEPEHFGAGAALRSVTDWAHYNHPYTANILNTPAEDSLAFARSSPIYFAEGLEDPLLIAHGMVDTNVQFQDVVRLAQRLIELGKVDWEMAVYPVESHGFTEPASWTDEYRRILELIEETVGSW